MHFKRKKFKIQNYLKIVLVTRDEISYHDQTSCDIYYLQLNSDCSGIF